MSHVVDSCGLSCPQPVLLFLNAVKENPHGPYSVLVDNDASRENVSRAARNRGFAVEEEDQGNGVTRLNMVKT